MKRVVVVGAGVSGLAVATFLGEDDLDVTVLEAAERPGGNVRTDIVEGRVVDSPARLRNAIAHRRAGDSVQVDFLREGQPMTITLVLAPLPQERNPFRYRRR